MNVIKIISRVALIATNIVGIYGVCDMIEPYLPSKTAYMALFAVSFGTIIDWTLPKKMR